MPQPHSNIAPLTSAGADRLFSLSHDLLWLAGLDGYFRRVNPAFEQAVGYASDELCAVPYLEWVHPDDVAATRVQLARLAAGFMVDAVRNRVRCKDGSYRWLQWRASPPDEHGIIYGVARDVTEQRQMKSALRAREASLQWSEALSLAVMDISLDSIITMDHTGVVTEFNAAAVRTFGYAREHAIGRDMAELIIPPGQREAHRRGLARLVAGGAASVIGRRIEVSAMRSDGSEFPAELAITRLMLNGPPLFAGFIRDITSRRQAEEALRLSEASSRSFVEHAPYGIYRSTTPGEFLAVSPALVTMLGYESREDLEAVNIATSVYDDPADRSRLLAASIHEGSFSPPAELRWKRRDGTPIKVRLGGGPVRDSAGAILYWEGFVEDVSALESAEHALRESEARYRLLFDRNPMPMWLYDTGSLAILAVNDAATQHYGYSRDEFLSLHLTDLTPAATAPQSLTLLPQAGMGRVRHGPHQHRRKDGTLITVEIVSDDAPVAGRPTRLILAIDVTDRRILEAQLRQAQKMEAVGQLAGGVAHDFNNLLTAIIGYGDMLLESLAPEDGRREDLAEIRKAADRAAGLTRQLLAFSRKQIVQLSVVDLDAVIDGLEPMLRRLIGEDIAIAPRAMRAAGRVTADAGQIEQVLVNLVVNARDAMPQGGTIRIETTDVVVDEQYGLRHGAEVTPGPYVVLTVSDTGVGMDQATQSRIFEPFYTTKDVGKGTGLGLSTVYGIVKQSGGFVWVYSEVGQGTRFKIYLPKATDDAVVAAPILVASPAPPAAETILVAEDDDAVRSLACRILERQGYLVLQARNGSEAMRVVAEFRGQIDLIITDVVMPEMGGRDLAMEIESRRPDTRVLFMSGYTDDEMIRRGILGPQMAFLEKPFTAIALTETVRKVLDAATDSPAMPAVT